MSTALVHVAQVLSPRQTDEVVDLLDERELAKLELMAGEVRSILAAAISKPVESDADEGRLGELMARGVIARKELQALLLARVAPLEAEVASVRAIFKRLTEPLKQFDLDAERRIVQYRAAKRQRIEREQREALRRQEEAARREAEAVAAAEAARSEEERRAALAAAEAASQEQMAAAVSAPAPMTRGVKIESGTLSERERWTFEVVRPDLVPREYLKVDDSAVRKAIAAGCREIPGLNIFAEERLRRTVRP